MSGRLVVAVNGGTRSDAALDWAISWAVRQSMSIEVCTVLEGTWEDDDYDVLSLGHQRVLDSARDRVEETGNGVAASYVLHRGSLVDALVALSRHSDVLVVGSRSSAMIAGVIHGTLALKLAERITTALVVVPERWAGGDGRIVAGVDDDSDSEALSFASRAAAASDEELILVQAVEQPVYYSPFDFGGRPELLDEQRQISKRFVASTCETLRKRYPGLKVDGRVAVGNASLVMVHSAQGASLAVVGTHSRGVLMGVLLGSVSRDLLMNMPCPVAVVPPAEPTPLDDDLALITSLAQ